MSDQVSVPPKKVTRDDIERELRKLQDDVSGKVDAKRNTLVTGAAVGGLVVLLIFFLLGKRAGKEKTTLVEIRRL